MKSVMNAYQHATRCLYIKLLGSSGTLSISKGATHISASRTSAGIYVVTFNDTYAQVPGIFPVAVMASTGAFIFANARAITAAGFTLETGSEGGSNADADVDIFVFGADSADEM